MKKTVLAAVSGVVLAVGTAGAEPPSTVEADNSAAAKGKITVSDKTKPSSAIMIKEDVKPGKQTAVSLKVKEDSTPGKNMDFTRR